ncbi:MAG TPA: anti-sigma factor antagonist [bacterium]|nr:anti-sigma factor antagonist [bacterium]
MRVLLAALCVGVLVWALHAELPADAFLFLYALPVIGAAAYLGGRIPGGVAGIISLIAARYFIVSPVSSFSLFPAALPVLGLFAVLAAFTVEASVRLRDADIAARKLASIVESSDDAIFSEALDGTIRTWNAGAERLYGYAPAEVIGRSVAMLAPPDHADEIAGILSRLRRGERIERHESVRVKKDGTRFDVSLTISAIRTASGMIAGASVIARDISDRKRVERQQQVLAEAGDALARSLDVDANLETLAGLLVAALADWCIIDLAGDDGTLRTAITMHRDPARMALMREVQRRYPPDPRSGYGSTNAVRTGRAELYPEVSDALLEEAVPNAALRSIMRSLGSRSAMVLPLTARERAFGAITLFSAESARRYTGADLVFAEELARRAALALDNARLHRSEQLQRAAAQRAADRIGRMQAVTAALSEAVTPEQVADVIVTHALQTLGGNAAGLSLIGSDGSTLELARAVGYPSDITQRRRFSLDEHPVLAAAIRARRVVWHEPDGDPAVRDPEHERLPDAFRPGARAAIPMMLHGRAIGVLDMHFRDRQRPAADDLESMLTLGWQCGQAIERARLYAREHRVAETLQRAFLPGVLPQLPGIAVHASYRSGGVRESDIGGDWYDVFRLPNGHLALSIGDVAGRGLRAAVTMGQLRQSIRAAALEHTDPSIVLKRASDLLALTDGDDAMATALFGVLDPNTSVLAYATAGHPAPILVGHNLEPTRLGCGGLPLGYLGDEPLPLRTVELPPGSLLVLYTDGLVETRHDPIVGEAAVIEAARRELVDAAADHAEGIVRRVLTHEPIRDDIAVITLAVAGTRLDQFEITLPAEPRNAVLIRQALRRLAADAGLDRDRLASVTVAVGEAVNNVIEHAYGAKTGSVRVRARLDRSMLRIDVADEGTWRPARPSDGGGHGLHVMKALVDVVDVDTTPAGTTVRLTVKLPDDRDRTPQSPSSVDGRRAAPTAASTELVAEGGPPRSATPLPPGRPVTLEISQINGIPVVTVAGDLDLESADAFRATLDRAARAESGTVIVSLGDATYLDSHAVGTLLRFGRRLTTNRRKLLVVAPSSAALRRIVDIAGMQAVLRIFDSLTEAMHSVLPAVDAS